MLRIGTLEVGPANPLLQSLRIFFFLQPLSNKRAIRYLAQMTNRTKDSKKEPHLHWCTISVGVKHPKEGEWTMEDLFLDITNINASSVTPGRKGSPSL